MLQPCSRPRCAARESTGSKTPSQTSSEMREGGEKQKPKGEIKPPWCSGRVGGTAGAQGWVAPIHPSAAIAWPHGVKREQGLPLGLLGMG